jgi:hypothetical protein
MEGNDNTQDPNPIWKIKDKLIEQKGFFGDLTMIVGMLLIGTLSKAYKCRRIHGLYETGDKRS